MRRIPMLACAIATSALTLTGAIGGPVQISDAHAHEAGADDCVGFRKTDLDKGLEYSVSNACSRKLACTVSWTLKCESNEGRITSKKRSSARVALGADDTASVTASADACTQSWSIDEVGWKCDEAK